MRILTVVEVHQVVRFEIERKLKKDFWCFLHGKIHVIVQIFSMWDVATDFLLGLFLMFLIRGVTHYCAGFFEHYKRWGNFNNLSFSF
jgi:hypothetical protein